MRLSEFETFKSAASALEHLNGTEILGQTVSIDWAFIKGPLKKPAQRRPSPGLSVRHLIYSFLIRRVSKTFTRNFVFSHQIKAYHLRSSG